MTIKNKAMELIEERLEDIAELRRMAIIEGCREEDGEKNIMPELKDLL